MPDHTGRAAVLAALAFGFASAALAQPGFGPPGGDFGFGGRGPGGRGGMGGMGQKREILKDFDKNGVGYLDVAERKAARQGMRGRMQFGGRGFRGSQTVPKPGAKITAADVKRYADEPLYSTGALRTFFLEFDDAVEVGAEARAAVAQAAA